MEEMRAQPRSILTILDLEVRVKMAFKDREGSRGAGYKYYGCGFRATSDFWHTEVRANRSNPHLAFSEPCQLTCPT